jgi:hypothetical protein
MEFSTGETFQFRYKWTKVIIVNRFPCGGSYIVVNDGDNDDGFLFCSMVFVIIKSFNRLFRLCLLIVELVNLCLLLWGCE